MLTNFRLPTCCQLAHKLPEKLPVGSGTLLLVFKREGTSNFLVRILFSRFSPIATLIFSPEAELFRKIRIQMRALDTLQMASCPITSSSLRADPQLRTATRTQEEKLWFLQTDFGFQPRVNPAVPDYEGLYKAFQRRAAKRRDTREVTRNKPFLLRTASLHHTQRPCDAAASGGTRVRAQAVVGGSGPEA